MAKTVVITGIRDIDRRLKSLEPRLQKKVIRKAMREGLKLLAAEVKSQAPADTGATRAAVKVRAVRSRKRGSIELEVRVKASDELVKTSDKTGEAVFYPAITEYGANGRPPDPFMRRSYAAKGDEARRATIDAIRAGVESEASRP